VHGEKLVMMQQCWNE